MRAADALVRAIVATGSQHLFTLSGNQIMSVFDATIEVPLELIHVRHEAAAVHAADAVGRLTGLPGIALVTAGPGFANTLSALYVAQCAESPVVLISGSSPALSAGLGAFQEMDQEGLSAKVCKKTWTCTKPEEITSDFMQAYRIAASGRPGPVHLVVPVDLLESEVSAQGLEPQPTVLCRELSLKELDSVSQIISDSTRPVVIAGPPYRRHHLKAALRPLRENGIPVIAMDSPRGWHDPSLGAFTEALPDVDLIVLLGKRLDHLLDMGASPPVGPRCQFIHIDPDEAALRQSMRNAGGRMLMQAHGAVADWSFTLAERTAGFSFDRGWRSTVESALAYRPPEWRTAVSDSPVHPAQLGYAVHDFLDKAPESVFISDGGEIGQWTQACVNAPHRIINGPAGSIGLALPFALGARTVFPNARIAATLGDGAFGFHPLELDTAVRHKLPFVAVIGNDSRWNAEVQIQNRAYGADRAVGCYLRSTRYHEIARALDAYGESVTSSADLPAALEAAHKSQTAACVDVRLKAVSAPVILRR